MNEKNIMYSFVDNYRPNPLCGKCENDCIYCYIHGKKGMKHRFPILRDKYNGEYRLDRKVFDIPIKDHGKPIFFCDCIDYLANGVKDEIVLDIWEWIERYPKIRFLSLTKNPMRYFNMRKYIPHNIIIGATIESNINNSYIIDEYHIISKALSLNNRLEYMIILNDILKRNDRFISIEPVLDFDLYPFVNNIKRIDPNWVAIGYDNYNYRLYEPSLITTKLLIEEIKKLGIIVYEKSIRKAWWEK